MTTFSVRETAKDLAVSVATVYGLCSRRLIRHQRIGLGRGTIRIPEDAIEEYRRGVTVSAAEATPAPQPRRIVTLSHLKLRTSD